MDRTEEKLQTFTAIVLKEAARRKQEIIEKAEAARREMVESNELKLLKDAHEAIQDSLRSMGRASNEEVSRTILESKQALFTRREEIIAAVFKNVSARLMDFHRTPAYAEYLARLVRQGYEELGDGDIRVMVDEEDLELAAGLQSSIDRSFAIEDSPDALQGGCLFINRTTGRMCDFSMTRQLENEKHAFLERYDLSLDG